MELRYQFMRPEDLKFQTTTRENVVAMIGELDQTGEYLKWLEKSEKEIINSYNTYPRIYCRGQSLGRHYFRVERAEL